MMLCPLSGLTEKACHINVAVNEIIKFKGIQFDPKVVDAFFKIDAKSQFIHYLYRRKKAEVINKLLLLNLLFYNMIAINNPTTTAK